MICISYEYLRRGYLVILGYPRLELRLLFGPLVQKKNPPEVRIKVLTSMLE